MLHFLCTIKISCKRVCLCILGVVGIGRQRPVSLLHLLKVQIHTKIHCKHDPSVREGNAMQPTCGKLANTMSIAGACLSAYKGADRQGLQSGICGRNPGSIVTAIENRQKPCFSMQPWSHTTILGSVVQESSYWVHARRNSSATTSAAPAKLSNWRIVLCMLREG